LTELAPPERREWGRAEGERFEALTVAILEIGAMHDGVHPGTPRIDENMPRRESFRKDPNHDHSIGN
jgi:hypothetical protein